MAAVWWIYDERDRELPGWRQWRVHGLFKEPPGQRLDRGSSYALLQSLQDGVSQWRVGMLRPGSGSMHELATPSAWGPVHKALVAPPGPRLCSEWVWGVDSLAMEIDELQASAGALHGSHFDLIEKTNRARSAPRLWSRGSRAAPAYAASMAMWASSMDEWTGRAELRAEDPLMAQAQVRRMEACFLSSMAGGEPSPAQCWLGMAGLIPEGEWRNWCEELGARMESGEIGACAGAPGASVKAKRI